METTFLLKSFCQSVFSVGLFLITACSVDSNHTPGDSDTTSDSDNISTNDTITIQGSDSDSNTDASTDSGSDSNTDTSTDTDSDSNTDTSTDSDSDTNTEIGMCAAPVSGTFTDSRDSQTYQTVTLGTQTWMAENLRYDTGLSSGQWIYANDMDHFAAYGYMYTQATAKSVCPSGWHLPSESEWLALVDCLGGATEAGGKLKATGTLHWLSPNTGANNDSGFSARPAGQYIYSTNSSLSAGETAFFWSSSNDVNDKAYYVILRQNAASYYGQYYHNNYGFSVRCLAD